MSIGDIRLFLKVIGINLLKKAKLKKITITKHYPALNKFQNNSVLHNANIFDKCVINLFVKKQNNLNYLNKTVKFLNNIK